jgi:hypothetical protein
MGQFWAVLVRMAGRRECSWWQIVFTVSRRARRVYHGAISEIKTEISADVGT